MVMNASLPRVNSDSLQLYRVHAMARHKSFVNWEKIAPQALRYLIRQGDYYATIIIIVAITKSLTTQPAVSPRSGRHNKIETQLYHLLIFIFRYAYETFFANIST